MSSVGGSSDGLRRPKEPADGVMGVNTGPVGSSGNPGRTERRRKGLLQAGMDSICLSLNVSPKSLQIQHAGLRAMRRCQIYPQLASRWKGKTLPLSWGSLQPMGNGHAWRKEATYVQMSVESSLLTSVWIHHGHCVGITSVLKAIVRSERETHWGRRTNETTEQMWLVGEPGSTACWEQGPDVGRQSALVNP